LRIQRKVEKRREERERKERHQEWQRIADERTRKEEERKEERRSRDNHFRWRCRVWIEHGPNPAGDNHPPWWSFPAIELVNSPFRNTPWILEASPRFPEERQIFHREDCTCPKSFPNPCFPDPKRHTLNAIYEEVNQEFTRLFAAAERQTTFCNASQTLWKVLHYCRYTERNTPKNHYRRTYGGCWVGQLLHHEVYEHLAHDCQRFIAPGKPGFARSCALRIIPRIIEHCVFRSGRLGPGGPARPIPESWGYPSTCNNTVLRCVAQKYYFPSEHRLNFKIYKFALGG
jgi:hypothetical protein